MEKDQKVELLSPAGNAEGFYGAVHAGADAVYLAGSRFGARAYADNFTADELVECIRYGHLMGRKIYLTVNTLLKDSELADLYDYLLPFHEAGLDAVIVQDVGVLRFVREHFPGCKLHVSTQMTLCGRHGASLLKAMGADRIIPSRELSLRELVTLKQNVDVEIETFVHGAMCYCYSGQCLFSSILGGRSGNRGRCAQPCRLPYSIVTGDGRTDDCYPLSLKDMCTIEHIPQLAEAGIDSFKIEGRMKRPEYTAGVTALYRRYIDKYYELRRKKGPEEAAGAYQVAREDLEALQSLYIRSEIQDGYYFRRGGREMITLDSPAYSKSDEKLLQEIDGKYVSVPLKLPITVTADFLTGQPAKVVLGWQGIWAAAEGALVEKAQKQPISPENIRTQLGKLGDSAFYASEINVSVGEDCFYPLKQMNELRRAAVAELERKILIARGYGTGAGETMSNPVSAGAAGKKASEPIDSNSQAKIMPILSSVCALSVSTMPQLEAVIGWLHDNAMDMHMRIYIDGDLCLQEQAAVISICERFSERCVFFATLPYIIRESDGAYLERLYRLAEESGFIKGFLVRSMDGLGFVRGKGKNISCRADAGLYIWNHSAIQEMAPVLDGFCLPYELNAWEQRGLLGGMPCEKIVYGRIPMMITANCLLRTSGKCIKEANRANPVKGRQGVQKTDSLAKPENMGHAVLKDRYHAVLRDRYRRSFPVAVNCLHCMNIIYNSVPLSLHQMLPKWQGCVDFRMDFTLESGAEVKRLLDSFLKGAPFPQQEYTTGHEKRGAE